MIARVHMFRRQVSIAALALVVLLLAGCSGGAFDSNDFFMGWLMTRPMFDRVKTMSGRVEDPTVSGILTAQKAMEDMKRADESYTQAEEARDKGDYSLAGDLLDEALFLRPKDIRYRRERAMVAVFAGDVTEANKQWEEQDLVAAETGYDASKRYFEDVRQDMLTLEMDYIKQPQSAGRSERLAAIYMRLSAIDSNRAAAAEMEGLPSEAKTLRTRSEYYKEQAEWSRE